MDTLIKYLIGMAVMFSFFLPFEVDAGNCGKVYGNKIVTQGVSCREAKRIYKLFHKGKKLPTEWVCGLSAGECRKGDKGLGFTFRNN